MKRNGANSDLLIALKIHAKNQGIRQEDLAREIGVRMVTISRWFNGHYTRIHHVTEAAVRQYLDKEGVVYE